MKSYDSYTIKNELIERMQSNKDWKAVMGNSVIGSIIDFISEYTAEQARYSEMLFLESRWDLSQDSKQIAALAGILGYQAKRKVSAAGTLYFSESNQIHDVGRTIFVKDFLAGDVPWAATSSKTDVTSDAAITDNSGVSYVFTSVSSLPSSSLYASNTIMQGEKKVVRIPASIVRETAKKSKLNPYAYVPFKIENIENANTSLTSPFFRVLVDAYEYRLVDSLLLSTGGDRDVEIIPDLYAADTYHLKFNLDPARGSVLNFNKASQGFEYIEIHYVESLGAEGNITDAFQRFTITTPEAVLYGISIDSIDGGADEESISDTKELAPQHYLTTYTTATKNAYEEAIKRIDLGDQQYAHNVKVYAGKNAAGTDVVFVSLINPEIESTIEEGSLTEATLNSILNLNLISLKAPSDTLEYVSPNYERVAIGIQCTVARGSIENISLLADTIQTTIDELYGQKSLLDFGKDLYDAEVIQTVKNLESEILSVKTELEVNDRLEWTTASRETPIGDGEAYVKTIRLPFDFSQIFTGNRFTFKDYQTGSNHSLRLDFFFKGTPTYHSTLIVKEPSDRSNERFVLIKDSNSIWHTADVIAIPWADYGFLDTGTITIKSTVDEIDDANLVQYYLKEKVMTDDSFAELIADTSEEELTSGKPGYISDILIYYIGDNEETERIGTGYIEFGIDSIYNVLQLHAQNDGYLQGLLTQYPLAQLKCSTNINDIPNFITNVLTPYVEIYASLRLYEKDLLINDQSFDPSAVIYAETEDSSTTTTNLATEKLNRFISVECDAI